MFIQIILALLAGMLAGIVTGLIPGLHINLISVILVSAAAALTGIISPIALGAFIIGMAVVHSFLDAIPSIYLGAPDEAQALAALPGHRMLLAGEGHHALMLTVFGSYTALLCCLFFSPLFVIAVGMIYPLISSQIGYILIAIMAYMVFKDSKRWSSLAVFLLSGALGLVVLNMPNSREVLLPMLSGLFGFSILLVSLMTKSTVPKQRPGKHIDAPLAVGSRAALGATITGFAASFLPGFSSSQAAIVATQFLRNIGDKGFLILVGGINTVNFTLSLVTFYVIEKARNGAVVAMRTILGSIDIATMFTFLLCALVAGSGAVFLAARISRLFERLVQKVNYRTLVLSILGFVTLLVMVFSGWVGMIILVAATALGLYAHTAGVGKNHCMGCLIVPVILYFVL